MMRLIKDTPEAVSKNNRVTCMFYRRWRSMHHRVAKYSQYQSITVCGEWFLFSAFRDWMQAQDWEGKELDKDAVNPWAKTYSPENCAFVTKEVQMLLVGSKKKNRKHLIGCQPNGSGFSAKIGVCGGRNSIGTFKTEREAHVAFCKAKAERIRKVAFLQNDHRVASGLFLHADKYEHGLVR